MSKKITALFFSIILIGSVGCTVCNQGYQCGPEYGMQYGSSCGPCENAGACTPVNACDPVVGFGTAPVSCNPACGPSYAASCNASGEGLAYAHDNVRGSGIFTSCTSNGVCIGALGTGMGSGVAVGGGCCGENGVYCGGSNCLMGGSNCLFGGLPCAVPFGYGLFPGRGGNNCPPEDIYVTRGPRDFFDPNPNVIRY